MVKNLILGAGITGLSTAYFLKKDYFLAEKENKVGGLAGSIEKNEYLFDYAEHFLRIPNDFIKNFLKDLKDENLFSQELKSAIYFKKKFITYPFQQNLRDLPIEELKKCAKSLLTNYFTGDTRDINKFRNFEEFIFYNYGDYIAKEFMIPYNEKIWSIHPSKLNVSWFLNSNLIPTFGLNQILDSILPLAIDNSKKKSIRWYPIKGGCQELCNSFLSHLTHLALNHKAVNVDLENKLVHFENGHIESFDNLISTLPLPELLKIIKDIPSEIKNLIPKLKYNSVYCLNLCLNKSNNYKYHWIYFPQKEIPFSRIFFSSNFSRFNAPIGKSSCSILCTFLPNLSFNFKQFDNKAIQTLVELGFLNDESEILYKIPVKIKYGFTLPTLDLSVSLNIIQNYLKKYNIFSIGRYGEWKYSGIEHAIEDGKKMALELLKM